MRYCLILTAALAAGLVVACTEKNPSAAGSSSASGKTRKFIPSDMVQQPAALSGGNNDVGAQPLGAQPAPMGTTAAAGPGAGAAAATSSQSIDTSDMPNAPADAQWTLYCQTIKGPNHVEQAKDLKAQLVRTTGLKDWYVIHGTNDSSNLYYGFYRSIDDSDRSDHRRDGVRAKQDRKQIDGLRDTDGNRPFSRCMFIELAAPDPDAPPEWNLVNAPDDMYWSVQVGAYGHSPDRKKAAVDAVREARKNGVPAYFYHGPAFSSVCIGSWPMEAVETAGSRVQSQDPTRDLLVLPPGMRDLDPKKLKNEKGQQMVAMKNEVQIVDPTMIATLQQYPEHSLNGMARIQKGATKPDRSFLVRIPNRYLAGERKGDSVSASGATDDGSATGGYSFLRPQHIRRDGENRNYIPRQTPGQGRLRSLD